MFSSPFNWCDRRCERCRLSPICAVAEKTKELPSELAAALEASFRETLALLEQIAREEGIDLDAVSVPPPLVAARAKRLTDILDSSDPTSLEGLIVRAKIARLEDRLNEPERDELYRSDTVPNLLLLERLIEQLHPLTAAALRKELAPLFDAIDAPLRGVLEMLIETGLAPSPFCISEVVEDGDPRRSMA